MFVSRSPPTKKDKEPSSQTKDTEQAGPAQTSKTDKNTEEREATKAPHSQHLTPKKQEMSVPAPLPARTRYKTVTLTSSGKEPTCTPPSEALREQTPERTFQDKTAEAKSWLQKAKIHLNSSRNTKTEIKEGIITSIDKMYLIIKELDKEVQRWKGQNGKEMIEMEAHTAPVQVSTPINEKIDKDLKGVIEENSKLIRENIQNMERLKEKMEEHQRNMESRSYASVAAGSSERKLPQQTALHSVVISSKDIDETGDDILNRIRETVKAKEGGIVIDRIRKAKDRKVIVGCRSEEERHKVKERLKRADKHLNVEDIQNKDPQLILKDVLNYNKDDDILRALRNQNATLFNNLDKDEDRVAIRYKKRTRNPLTSHIVLKVSPKIWRQAIDMGSVMIDLQRVKVEDQSPLVQCSLCLGYGHGRRFCSEKIEKCSHCAGPHKKADCPDWMAGATPTCCNCTHAKLAQVEHNAFSQDCPIRRKWEALARASVSYC